MTPEEIAIRLEEVPEEEAVDVLFHTGERFELINCWVVEQEIYGNLTTVIGEVVRKLEGDLRFNTPGTLLEFDASDVLSAAIVSDGKKVYANST